MTLVYITCKGRKEAENISMHLLKKRLIACANIFPIKSMYWWQGKIANGNESAVIAKTNSKNFKNLVKEVKSIHSYEIPCILKLNATANKDYEDWANKELYSRTKIIRQLLSVRNMSINPKRIFEHARKSSIFDKEKT